MEKFLINKAVIQQEIRFYEKQKQEKSLKVLDQQGENSQNYSYRMFVHNFKMIWNSISRNLVYRFIYLYDRYESLKFILSKAAQKVVKDLSESHEVKEKSTSDQDVSATELLNQLLSEKDTNFVAENEMKGTSIEEVLKKKFEDESKINNRHLFIDFINLQVNFESVQGAEYGYVVVSSERNFLNVSSLSCKETKEVVVNVS